MGYNGKLIDLGSYLKVVQYEKEIKTGKPFPRKKKSQVLEELNKIDNDPNLDHIEKLVKKAIVENSLGEDKEEKCTIKKPRKLSFSEMEKFVNLVIMNFNRGDKYITLTFRDEDITIDQGSKLFDNWIKRMRERYGDFKYIGVRSFQERGTLHYHLLANLPRFSTKGLIEFQDIWGYGYTHIEQVYWLEAVYDKSPLLKYLVKNLREFKEDSRSIKKRLYVRSKNLQEPIVIKGDYDELMERILTGNESLKSLSKRKIFSKYLESIETEIFEKLKPPNSNAV